MPGKVKVRILAGRNLPVMDKSSDTSDAFVEVCDNQLDKFVAVLILSLFRLNSVALLTKLKSFEDH